MIESLERTPETGADGLPAAGLLASIRHARDVENDTTARQLDLAAQWADLHPPESIHHAATFSDDGRWGRELEIPIAGEGCPMVAEFSIAELGASLGTSTTAAKRLVGHALELRHRLPRLWAQVQSGRVPAWRARAVAEATIHTTPALTPEAAAYVDSQVAAVASRIGPAQLDRLVAETIERYDLDAVDPSTDPEDGYLHVDPSHATLHSDDVHYAGMMRFEAELDIADALDLDRALARGAETLKGFGSEAPLDARRSAALGDLARTQTALDLFAHGAAVAGTTKTADGLPVAREVVLHAHFDATTVGTDTVFETTGRLEERQRLVLLAQVQDWCADTRTKVTIAPVVDVNAHLAAPGYDIPARLREQVVLRDQTCVFPHCSRPARSCDIDHVMAYDPDAEAEGRPQPGPTQTDNLTALCRSHHRLKTHSAWHYDMPGNGVYEWTSPHGHRYLRDHTGTGPLDPRTDAEAPPPDRP
ncbi:HNH endonuclease signature motif containing protein [Nocardioides xinjiangensis]|uniref:HNH endonuclease signature motif containing protein n=1 Tax=Nocardioides xinjiangensis TaxID=2817376 RepID=UPI001B3170ED|nr:HNH endonuclease signature motif containing protein [Nocardioides sp. SYSU D00514]